MPVKLIECQTAEEAFRLLLSLAQQDTRDIYFRGLKNDAYTIDSTFSRHTKFPHAMTETLETMVNDFTNSVLSTGKTLPFSWADRRAKLEYARHYGLPSPLIDWSFSPYVSMFFAFNGVATSEGKSVIYALDVQELSELYASAVTQDINSFNEARNGFFPDKPFLDCYPPDQLFFLKHPALWNVRMTRQMGAFLYDTLNYSRLGAASLEAFVEQTPLSHRRERNEVPLYALRKITVPHSEARNVFKHLALAGITGTRLLDDYEGAVADVINAYYFHRDHKTKFRDPESNFWTS
jgi:FRG domain